MAGGRPLINSKHHSRTMAMEELAATTISKEAATEEGNSEQSYARSLTMMVRIVHESKRSKYL